MSLQQHYRAKTLLKRGFASVVSSSERYICFMVHSTQDYSVIYERARGRWSCTCKFFSAYSVGKHCVHIKSCKLMVGGKYDG